VTHPRFGSKRALVCVAPVGDSCCAQFDSRQFDSRQWNERRRLARVAPRSVRRTAAPATHPPATRPWRREQKAQLLRLRRAVSLGMFSHFSRHSPAQFPGERGP
jgi:hypothetical protein